MLLQNFDNLYRSFPNYFQKENRNSLCQIYSLGWQMRTSPKYNWDGMKRPDEKGQCIFQYTLSGCGRLEYGDNSFLLEEGSAFMVLLPDKHRYFLPAESEKWEFIFITLTGEYAVKEWKRLRHNYGKIIKLSPKSEVLQYLWNSYWKFVQNNVTDGYQTSVIAYKFIMQLVKALDNPGLENRTEGSSRIENSIEYMKNNLKQQISLEDMAMAAGISKYHFSRLFNSVMGISPWDYLTKLRMEKAVYLMQTHSYKISEVAANVGYSSVNYFNKVFRKTFGTSPSKFELMYQGTDDFDF